MMSAIPIKRYCGFVFPKSKRSTFLLADKNRLRTGGLCGFLHLPAHPVAGCNGNKAEGKAAGEIEGEVVWMQVFEER